MRAIRESHAFKGDLKRVRADPRHRDIDTLLAAVLPRLCADVPLEPKYRDHSLSGEWRGSRDCHLRPDLVLIYRRPREGLLELVRLGTHSVLFRA